jgi:hypothetical protein
MLGGLELRKSITSFIVIHLSVIQPAMASSFILAFLSLNALASIQPVRASDLDIRDVLSRDMMDMYGDYEILSLEERSDEDVV